MPADAQFIRSSHAADRFWAIPELVARVMAVLPLKALYQHLKPLDQLQELQSTPGVLQSAPELPELV